MEFKVIKKEICDIRNYFFIFVFLTYSFFNIACSSKLAFQSEPQSVEVFVYSNSGDKKLLGTTPLEVSFAEIEKWNSLSSLTGALIPLSFEKKDFESQKILLPPSRAGLTSAAIFIKMKTGKDEGKLASALLQHLHNAQKFAAGGNFELAQQEVDKALEKEPLFIRAISMKGALFYVQKNWTESLKWYNKALEQDPQFDEAIQYVNEIKHKKEEIH